MTLNDLNILPDIVFFRGLAVWMKIDTCYQQQNDITNQ